MYPIVAITGATTTAKTDLAICVANQTGATVLPLDQLHRYRYLAEGTGLDIEELRQVRHFGYQMLSPWEVSGPDKYVLWLRNALGQIAATGPAVIEGGCTSYLAELVSSERDRVLGEIRFVALERSPSEATNKERIEERFSRHKVARVISEVEALESHGFLCEAGLPLFRNCEQVWTHPEHEDRRLAWALRISARVYCPAYLALKGRITLDSARARIVRNVLDIQEYQSDRIGRLLSGKAIFHRHQVPALAQAVIGWLSGRTWTLEGGG